MRILDRHSRHQQEFTLEHRFRKKKPATSALARSGRLRLSKVIDQTNALRELDGRSYS
jgi:hypothetical protein